MKQLISIYTIIMALGQFVCAQGTLIFDQQSSTDENYSPLGGGGSIQFYGSVGQSFVPGLAQVGFVRVRLFDAAPGSFLGASVVLNLRSDAINGPVLATSPVVSMTNGFFGSINFIFAQAVAVSPGTTYYFDLSVQSGDEWGFMSLGDTYADGAFYGGQFPFSGADLWFREGVAVPEPSSLALVGLGAGLSLLRHKQRQMQAASCVMFSLPIIPPRVMK